MKTGKKHIRSSYQIAFILILTFIAYSPALQNGFTNWDDPLYVTDNPLIRTINWQNLQAWFTQSFQGLYQPLVLFSLAIDHSINGLDPFYFHLTNLVLHLANTLLVFVFIQSLFKNRISALIVTLIFGLHPIHVESVAWITERKDVLYSFFFLISLNFYVFFRRTGSWKYYTLTLLFFILALMSKVSAVILPLLLILIDYYNKRKLWSKSALIEKLPLLILSLFFGLWNIYTHLEFGSLANYSNLSVPVRMFLASKGLMYYLSKTIWPVNLAVYNPLPLALNSYLIIECLFYLLIYLSLGFIVLRFKSRILIFGMLFFLVSILFFLVPPGEPVLASERYGYISSIGLFVVIAYLFKQAIIKLGNNAGKFTVYSVFLLWLGFLGYQTHQQTRVWKSSFTLWNHVVNVRDDSFLALLQRGNAYAATGELEAAIIDYDKSIKIYPKYYKTYDRRGHTQLLRGNFTSATEDFLKSIELNPKGVYAYLSLGFIYRNTGNTSMALYYLEQALAIEPQNPEAYYNRGKIYLKLDQTEKACSDFKKALQYGIKGKNLQETNDLVNSLCK